MKNTIKLIEALLFSSSDPVSLKKIRDIVSEVQPMEKGELEEMMEALKQELDNEDGVYQLVEIAEGWQLRTKKEYAPYIAELHRTGKKDKLSHAASEVLSIIAFKQPITRAEIDEIRGVDSSGIIYSLLERQLIESVGKLEVAGRPTQFGTTERFLQHYGLKNLEEFQQFFS